MMKVSVNCFIRCTLQRSTGSLICGGAEYVFKVFSSDISPLVTLLFVLVSINNALLCSPANCQLFRCMACCVRASANNPIFSPACILGHLQLSD